MKRRSRKKQAALDLATFLPLVTGGVVFGLDVARRVYRRSQLFCPDVNPTKSWDPQDYGIPRERTTEHWLETPDGELLYAWYARAEKPVASGIFCHGNTGNLTTSAEVIPHMLDAGFNVLMFDYRGFGRSTGSPSLAGVVSDGITAARFHDQIRPKHLPSLLYGFSLGGAIAAQVIKHYPFDGMILQSTFTTLPELTRVAFPRLPLHLVSGNFFDTLGVIKKLNVPLLILHGDADEVIPCWMAHRLFETCNSPKRIRIVEQGLHKDLYVRDADALVWELSQFVAELPRNREFPQVEVPSATAQFVDTVLRMIRKPFRRRPAPHSAPQSL